MKKGLRQFTASATDIQAGSVFGATVPTEGGTHYSTGMGLLGNGDWGDCYWASAARESRTLARIAGRPGATFSEDSVVSSYVAYLGLTSVEQLTERTDEGTDARAGAKFRTGLGIADDHQWQNHYQEPGAQGHRIGAYAFETDAQRIPALVDALGAATLCIDLTSQCEQEFAEAEKENRPFVWDTKLGTSVAGGHAIPVTYWTPQGLGVNSWDREGIVTWDYLAKYMQTTVVYFSAAILDPEGENPAGLNKAKLLELVKEVKSA